MKISVRVKAGARKNDVQCLKPRSYRVSVTSPPVDNRANEMVIDLLAEYFDKPRRFLRIVKGRSSRDKIIEIPD